MRSEALIRFWSAYRRRNARDREIYLGYSDGSPPSTWILREIVAALGGKEYWLGLPEAAPPGAGRVAVRNGCYCLEWGDDGLWFGGLEPGIPLIDGILSTGHGHIVSTLPNYDPARLPSRSKGLCGALHDCLSGLRPIIWEQSTFYWRDWKCLGVSHAWQTFWSIQWAVPQLYALRVSRTSNPFVEALIERMRRLAYVRAEVEQHIYQEREDREALDVLADVAILLATATLDTLACAVMWDHTQGSSDAIKASFDLRHKARFRSILSRLLGDVAASDLDTSLDGLTVINEIRNLVAHRRSTSVKVYEGFNKPRFQLVDEVIRTDVSPYDGKAHLIELAEDFVSESFFSRDSLASFGSWLRKCGGAPFLVQGYERLFIDVAQMVDTLFAVSAAFVREVSSAMADRCNVETAEDVLRKGAEPLERVTVVLGAATGSCPEVKEPFLRSSRYPP